VVGLRFEPDVYEELLEKMAQSVTITSKATSKADTLAFGRAIDLAILRNVGKIFSDHYFSKPNYCLTIGYKFKISCLSVLN
jgi:hypothetical protein